MKLVAKYITVLIAIIAVTGGCKKPSNSNLSAADYLKYVEAESNDLRTTVVSGIWSYGLQYKPTDYIAIREQNPQHFDKMLLQKRAALFKNTIWFNVTLRVDNSDSDPLKYGVKNLEDYNKRLDYFLIQAARNFHLAYGQLGEMEQIGYHFENNYNLKPEVTAIVGFRIPDPSPLQAFTLSYSDELFNSGIIKFNVPLQAIKNTPGFTI